jgi:hypothetical protein
MKDINVDEIGQIRVGNMWKEITVNYEQVLFTKGHHIARQK